MRAAIYVRKSTEQVGVADDQKSVARQIEHARAYATRKGWSVSEEHTFVDEGISGAEFASRPGFVRLMNALKPRPVFQVLVMSEESRLGREAIETAYALKQIVTAGVRVFFYLEDRERVLDSPTDKIMLSLTAFADELEREKARQRTYDAMARKARSLHVTGGRCFGYRNVEVRTPDGRRAYVTREVDPKEAAVVRRIFELWVSGVGLTSISKTLNEDGVPCPRPQRGRPEGWCSSSVRTILYREVYRGEVVWNRTRKRNAWGIVCQRKRAPEEWVRIPAPELRIISDDVWAAAHRRLASVRQRWLTGMKGRPFGSGAKYLLTGLLRCATCGSGIEARSRRQGSRRVVFYGCSGYHRKGTTVCRNGLTLPMDIVDHAVMTAVEESLLRPELVERALNKAIDALVHEQSTPSDRDGIATELARIKTELARCVELAAAGGGDVAAVLAAIRQREQRRRALEAELARCGAHERGPRLDKAAIRAELRQRIGDWRELLRTYAVEGQRLLRTLIDGRLNLTPVDGTYYRFEGVGTLAPVLAGVLPRVPRNMASPRAFAPFRNTGISVGIDFAGVLKVA